MQFLLIAYDYKDGGFERRMAVREKHLKLMDTLKKHGHVLMAIAMIDQHDKMIGSTMILDFPTREKVDEYLKSEPYVLSNVWETVEIIPGKIPPTFKNNIVRTT